jgi:hypothetical protein
MRPPPIPARTSGVVDDWRKPVAIEGEREETSEQSKTTENTLDITAHFSTTIRGAQGRRTLQ